jgi:hypothetical protein
VVERLLQIHIFAHKNSAIFVEKTTQQTDKKAREHPFYIDAREAVNLSLVILFSS